LAIRGQLTVLPELILWALLGVAMALLLRRGWLRLFGPMLFYELVRVARRRRYFYFRCLYVLLLSLMLGWVYLIWYLDTSTGRMRSNEMARFAEAFFYTFMSVQFIVMVVLTPAYTAGAIAEEKERRTLEFVLATDLRNREIVLSKLLSRMANITLLMLAGLPILSFLQFLGGVDPNLVLAGFAATGLTMFSLAGLSILNSAVTKRPRDAIALTYLGAAAYLILSAASWALLIPTGFSTATWTLPWLGPVTVKDFAHTVSVGNIVAVCFQLAYEVSTGKNIADSLPAILRDYALFHGLVALVCTGWAVLRLRALALKQSYGKVQKLPWQTRWWGRPGVGARPMLWKEVFIESGVRFNALGRILVLVLVIASFIPVVFIFDEFFHGLLQPTARPYYPGWEALNRAMNIWVRVLGSLVACLMLLAVAARASSSISNERDRQTFDALLTTPLDSNAILSAKWIGNVLSVRWAWLWLGAIYALALLTGGLHPLALPLLLGAWIIYALVVSGIGLWFSMVCRTTLRATLWTLLCTAGAGVGHWLLWMCCIPLFITVRQQPTILEGISKFQVGFTPPLALGYCFSFCWLDLREFGRRDTDVENAILYGLLGVVCWIILAAFLGAVNGTRFRVLTGRAPIKRPPTRAGEPQIPPAAPNRPGEAAGQAARNACLDGETESIATVVAVEEKSADIAPGRSIEEAAPEDRPRPPTR
jgi:ABC-type Na+ efflux pump permease subunit